MSSIQITKHSEAYWRVTVDIPPLNIFGPANIPQLEKVVTSIENDAALIDVGLKSEGRVALKEFSAGGGPPELHVGDIVEVFLERMEDKNGEAQLSREKARREEAWTLLEKSFTANERVTGTIFGRVKGGFTVDPARLRSKISPRIFL